MKPLLVAVFLIPLLNFSQCPPSSTFSSQAQIDALAADYPDCTVLGSFTIEGDDITDLSGLNQITNANFLTVVNNPILENLNGLNSSLSFYDPVQPTFSISNNASLLDISALATVSADAEFDIYIVISDNPLLSSLNGIQGFTWATTFTVRNNDSLTSLDGLGNASEVTIDGNDGLIDLSGLIDVEWTYLVIENNISLQSLGLINLQTEYLFIRNNPNLVDISKPEESEIWGFNNIELENNSSLSVCNVNYLCSHLSGEAFFSIIRNNAPGCSDRIEVELSCGIAPYNDECSNIGFNYIIDVGETISFNNELATESTQVPSCNDIVDRQDVWAIFNSGELTSIDITVGSGFNIQLWEGDCSSLVQVSDACGSEMLVDIPVTQDAYYTVQIWSDDTGRMTSGWFDLLVQDGSLSTPEFEFTDVLIYPNPAQNELNIQSNLPIDNVEVYNLLGQQVLESRTTSLDVSELSMGLYLVKVIIDGKASTHKILKQ